MIDKYQVLVTDCGNMDWLASQFIFSMKTSNLVMNKSVHPRWLTQPSWAESTIAPLNYKEYKTDRSTFDIYSFPCAIPRDFSLEDIDIQFDGVIFLVDLGSAQLLQQLWEGPDVTPQRRWGRDLVEQISAVTIILAIESSTKNVPVEYVSKLLPAGLDTLYLTQTVDTNEWNSSLYFFSEDVIHNIFRNLESKLLVNGASARMS